MQALVQKMLTGDAVALARLMSLIENQSDARMDIMTEVQDHCGHAQCVGMTGPPGAGKSTLVNLMIAAWRKQKKRVGVVAIDPSSPFSGGAVLGDRIRMQEHAGDDGVFIRSLGSRGSHGGLSRSTRDVVKLYDAFGMDLSVVETVGVGQTELDIMEIADTTVVVLTPESGDTIQTMKAGILEIADIFLVNKADRPGASQMKKGLQQMLLMGPQQEWEVPILLTNAVKGEGLEELSEALAKHHQFIQNHPRKDEHKRASLKLELSDIILSHMREPVEQWIKRKLDQSKNIAKENPYRLAKEFLVTKSR